VAEFLRDYPNLFPVVVAVLNGALAAISTNYPFKSACRKMAFIAIVLSLSVCAVLAAAFSQHLINAQKAEERAWWGLVREQLGTFIARGTALFGLTGMASQPLPTEQARQWTTDTENYLSATLGNSYVIRFRDSSGIPPVVLEQFSQELPH
jgi:hypothetical protein